MKKLLILFLVIACIFTASCGEKVAEPQVDENVARSQANDTSSNFTYEFADKKTAEELLLSNTHYHENLNKNDLEYRLQKKGATLDEYLNHAVAQVRDFTDEEKTLITNAMNQIELIIDEEGYSLPKLDCINFVKTTMEEEGGAVAYTHQSDIYLGEYMLEMMVQSPEEYTFELVSLLTHEIFHCLTRNHPDFRADIYSVIGFSVAQKDFEISPRIREIMLSNPDVQNHDSYNTFTINGEKTDCFTVFISTKNFENPGDTFFGYSTTGLVPIDSPDTLYTMDDAVDFWEVFGENTSYVIDTEECLAENFSIAFLANSDQYKDIQWPNPEIIEGIRNQIKK